MTVLYLLLVLAAIGVLAWAITEFVPMPEKMKQLIVVVACLIGLFYVLAAFGVLQSHIAVPKLK